MTALDVIRTLRRAGHMPCVLGGKLLAVVRPPPFDALLQDEIGAKRTAIRAILVAGDAAHAASIARFPNYRKRANKARLFAERLAASDPCDPMIIALRTHDASSFSF